MSTLHAKASAAAAAATLFGFAFILTLMPAASWAALGV